MTPGFWAVIGVCLLVAALSFLIGNRRWKGKVDAIVFAAALLVAVAYGFVDANDRRVLAEERQASR